MGYALKRIDHSIAFELNVYVPLTTGVIDGGIIGVSLLHRECVHTNPLRNGTYIDLTIKADGYMLKPGMIAQQVFDKLRAGLPAHLVNTGIQEMLLEHLQLGTAGQISGGITRLYRFYLPSQKELAQGGYRELFTRDAVEAMPAVGGTAFLPLPGGVSLGVGVSKNMNMTRVLGETFSGNTLIHALMYYMHEKYIGHSLDACWDGIVKQQRAAFSQIFIQLGNDRESIIQSEMRCFLAEIAAFSGEGVDNIKGPLYATMAAFAQDTESDIAFNNACSALTQFMDAYYPIWNHKCINSPCLTAQPLVTNNLSFDPPEEPKVEPPQHLRTEASASRIPAGLTPRDINALRQRKDYEMMLGRPRFGQTDKDAFEMGLSWSSKSEPRQRLGRLTDEEQRARLFYKQGV